MPLLLTFSAMIQKILFFSLLRPAATHNIIYDMRRCFSLPRPLIKAGAAGSKCDISDLTQSLPGIPCRPPRNSKTAIWDIRAGFAKFASLRRSNHV